MRYLTRSLFSHIASLALLFFFYSGTPKPEKRRTLRVSSIKLDPHATSEKVTELAFATPQESLIPAPPPPPPEKKPEEKKQPEKKPAVKKETPKKDPPKKETPKKEVVAKAEIKKEPPKIDSKKESLLKEARESLAKMGKTEATSQEVAKQTRAPLTALKADPGLFSIKGKESDFYTEELIKRLKLGLRLPESGEVVVDVTLQRTGKIAKVKIREAKSSINKNYVEATLPSINFPSFGESYPQEDEKLFTLSLQNALY